jgi:hypothetical protein
VTIDTVAPATPPVPDLLAASDSGASDSDDLTNNTTPTFTGPGEPQGQLTAFLDGLIVRKAITTADPWFFAAHLTDGAHAVSVTLTDAAGNESQHSPALDVTVDTVAPRLSPLPPSLVPLADTGFSNSDRLTSLNTPVFTITPLEAPLLWDVLVDGTVRASATDPFGGQFFVRVPPLQDGPHSVELRPTDPAGNQGPATEPLVVTIDTVGPRVLGAPLIDTANGPTSLRYDLSDEIPAGVAADALAITDLTRGQAVPAAQVRVDFDPAVRRALFTFPGFLSGRLPAGRYEAVLRPEAVQDRAGNGLSEESRVEFTVPEVSGGVVGRFVFYNHSTFDGNDPAATAADDAAIATDKRPLLPGTGSPAFANVTSFDKGINGVMIDVAALPQVEAAGTPLGVADFDFGGARPPASVTVRRGAGTGGSDRVTLLWTDFSVSGNSPTMALQGGWLTVTVKADARTGLAAPDVFSFGNLIGETGEGFRVNSLDLGAVKRALNSTTNVVAAPDVNRDGRVNALDLGIVKRNLNHTLAPPVATPASVPPRQDDTPVPARVADGLL